MKDKNRSLIKEYVMKCPTVTRGRWKGGTI